MFTEIMKIIPKVDNGDLNKMESQLSARFGKVAKKFGRGLVSALMGGGIAGAALAVIDKFINPLKDVQDSIDRVLHQGDDLVTNAKQFQTTPAMLARLQGFGKSQGLDPDSLNLLLTKFQTSLAEAKADPTKQTSVRNFANDKDIAASFFQFIQELKKLDPSKQVLVQQEVFGEKQILKMSQFLNADFDKLSEAFAGVDFRDVNQGAVKLDDLNNKQNTLGAVRDLNDLVAKSAIINEDIINQRDQAAQLNLDKENQRIRSYESLATIETAATKILTLCETGLLKLGEILAKLTNFIEGMNKLTISRFLRGIVGTAGTDSRHKD